MSSPKVHGPADLPALREWIAGQWLPGRTYHRTAAMAMSARGRGTVGHNGQPNAESYARWEHGALVRSTLWWVSEEMCDLLYATAPKIPLDVKPEHLIVPSGAGFVVLAKPWRCAIDADTGKHSMTVHGFAWCGSDLPPHIIGRGNEGALRSLSVSFYERLNFEDGLSPNQMSGATVTGAFGLGDRIPLPVSAAEQAKATHILLDRGGEVTGISLADSPHAIIETPDGRTLEEVPEREFKRRLRGRGESAYSLRGEAWMPLGRTDWPEGDELGTQPWPLSPEAHESMVEDRRMLAALWLLLATETLVAKAPIHVDRATRRRSERAGYGEPDVRFVILRKPPREVDGEPVEHRDVRWSRQWIVSAHPRLQPCGPRRSERKLIMVKPHRKGPPDKPLIVKPTVNVWVR